MSSVVETDRVNAIAMILTPRYLVSGILDTNITIEVRTQIQEESFSHWRENTHNHILAQGLANTRTSCGVPEGRLGGVSARFAREKTLR